MLLNTCAYAVVLFAVVGGSFAASLAVLPEHNGTENRTQVATKIGPGYGHKRPIDFGRPEKPVYTAHATVARSIVIATKRAAHQAILPVFSIVAPAKAPSPLIVAVAQPSYSAPDIHRVY
jgi:hypothetical protein